MMATSLLDRPRSTPLQEHPMQREKADEGRPAPFLQVRNLVAAYEGKVAVQGVSFELARGEHLSLLGPSGCGKSTLLRCIAGLEEPLEGEILIEARPMFSSAQKINVPPQKRNLSMVFQSYAIWPHMTVGDNVAYGLRVKGVPRAQARAAAVRALEMVGMADLIDRPATALSGGQQQRVAVARSLAPSPSAILLDEPLSNLDARLRAHMREELKELQSKLRISTLYVTHDQEEAMAISDRIIVMRAGRIEQEGLPLTIYNEPRTRFVADFIGASNVLSGTLLSSDAGGIKIRVGAAEITCTVVDRIPAPTRSGEHLIAIRRVYPQLSRTPDAALPNQWPATIVGRTLLGDLVSYTVEFAGGRLSIQGVPTNLFSTEEQVFVHLPPERVVVVAPDDEATESATH
jgi:ABC-type Fe3+/spermidine/putrescine transport system ATPase subunit